MQLAIARMRSPIGAVLVVSCADGLCAVEFDEIGARTMAHLRRRYGDVSLNRRGDPFGACDRLAAYFAGDVGAIDALPVSGGGTPFQESVWRALRAVPAGRTISYRELAARAGRPAAVRAAGHANGHNPVSIVVPCHRAIGSDGSLTGYGSGIERKRWLLAHEGVRLVAPHATPTSPAA